MRISDWSSDVCSSDLAAVPDEILLDPAIAQPAPLGVAGEHAIGEASVDDLGYRGGLARFGEARGGVDRGWHGQIGRASWRGRVCQDVSISVGAVSLKKKINIREVKKVRGSMKQ